jgi:hypothetical protein
MDAVEIYWWGSGLAARPLRTLLVGSSTADRLLPAPSSSSRAVPPPSRAPSAERPVRSPALRADSRVRANSRAASLARRSSLVSVRDSAEVRGGHLDARVLGAALVSCGGCSGYPVHPPRIARGFRPTRDVSRRRAGGRERPTLCGPRCCGGRASGPPRPATTLSHLGRWPHGVVPGGITDRCSRPPCRESSRVGVQRSPRRRSTATGGSSPACRHASAQTAARVNRWARGSSIPSAISSSNSSVMQ